jgi:O-antigen ligase
MSGLIFRLLLLLVILAPLPLGANREWAWLTCALLAGVIAAAWALVALFQPGKISLSLPPWAPLMFLGVCAWAWAQAQSGVNPEWWHPMWTLASEVLGEDIPGRISLGADDTLSALARLLAYGLVFLLAFQFGRDRQRAREAFFWLAGAGLLYALYGLVMFWGEFGMLLWFEDPAFNRDVRGTFVNRNSFATYLGLALLCTLALFNQKTAIRRNPVYQVPVEREVRVEQFVLQIWKPLAVLIIVTAALVLTHSRGGFFSSVAGVGVLLLLLNHRQKIGGVRAKAVMASALLVTVATFWLTSEVLLKRVERMEVDASTRLVGYELARDGIADNPLLGYGYGTFADSFKLYRDESISKWLMRAHNTYLENIFELGRPAAFVLFLAIGWLAFLCLQGARFRGRDWAYPATGVAATVLVGVHSMFDFSLQMPAIAMTYACLMGVAVAQAYPTRA